jgi:hypothetical protein
MAGFETRIGLLSPVELSRQGNPIPVNILLTAEGGDGQRLKRDLDPPLELYPQRRGPQSPSDMAED